MAEREDRSVKLLVRVRELALLADIGINPDEVGRRQPLVISVEAELNPRTISQISDTVDYRLIARAAENLALEHIPLIETFAQQLAKRCLAFEGVIGVEVTIEKPFALTRGMAGIRYYEAGGL